MLLLVCSNGAIAYGFLGHNIVANGAYGHLTPESAAMVRKILTEGTIADASVWPDLMRNTGRCEVRFVEQVARHRQSLTMNLSAADAKVWANKQIAKSDCKDILDKSLIMNMLQATDAKKVKAMALQFVADHKDYQFWQATKPWHYVNVSPGLTYQQSEKNPKGDIISAIQTFSAILSGKGAKHPAIMNSLSDFLGHLPNEVKHAKMREYALKFLVHFVGDLHQPLHAGYKKDLGGNLIKVHWFGESVNLHRVWDTSLIEGQKLTQVQFEQLMAEVSEKQKAEYMRSDLYDWLAEVLKMRVKVYDIKRYEGKMDQAYVDEHQAVFNQQLQKASVRLAMILNRLLR